MTTKNDLRFIVQAAATGYHQKEEDHRDRPNYDPVGEAVEVLAYLFGVD